MEHNFVITIGRQIGSGGLETARLLSEEFGIKMYDKELLYEVSRESGICPELFEKRDEKATRSKFGSFFGLRSSVQGNEIIPSGSIISDEELFKVQSTVMQKIASKESCVFVGRCADYILRDHPRCYSFFISAGINFRVQRIMKGKGIGEAEALRFIEQGDKKRASYYNYYTFKQWGDSSSYDMCIDSSKIGVDKVVEIIKYYINSIR
ncbi:MAG: cytidylate kinase-like family protein [Bacteroidales bacterium]|nr:cytidylate kinase-like family protein [Bacteroidales bacterium]MDD4670229.1 cytidylate kinase-like family protein [Bacteroidales bacterium]